MHFTGKSRCLYCKHIARIQPYLTDFSVSPLVPSKMISVASYLLHHCPSLYSHSLFAEYKPRLSLKICQKILYFASYFSLGKSQRPCNSLKNYLQNLIFQPTDSISYYFPLCSLCYSHGLSQREFPCLAYLNFQSPVLPCTTEFLTL